MTSEARILGLDQVRGRRRTRVTHEDWTTSQLPRLADVYPLEKMYDGEELQRVLRRISIIAPHHIVEYVKVEQPRRPREVAYADMGILTQGLQVSAILLLLSLGLFLVETVLGLAGVFFSVAVFMFYLYAFWLETRVPLLNPRHVIFGILGSIWLVILALVALLST